MTSSSSSLLEWLATFEIDGKASVELKDDAAYYHLADGYVCARILNQISPQYFSDEWLHGIRPVPLNGSWRLRTSNLNRILQKIYDYASDLQSKQFRPSSIMPDVAVIAQNFDSIQISRLIQLILFCAINCDKKQHYIERISILPTQVKHDIKEAIEELLIKGNGDSSGNKAASSQLANESVVSDRDLDLSSASQRSKAHSSSSLLSPFKITPQKRDVLNSPADTPTRRTSSGLVEKFQTTDSNSVDELRQRLKNALIVKDERSQACHELEMKVKQLQMEKDQLIYENERLSSETKATMGSSPRSHSKSRAVDSTDADDLHAIDKDLQFLVSQRQHNSKVHNELNKLKEELVKIESEKEEYRLKCHWLEDDYSKLNSKFEDLQNKAEKARRLQDELDEQRHVSEKVTNYESAIEILKKKNAELKSEIKALEAKNLAHIHKMVKLEEEKSQLANSSTRIDIYKNQLKDIQVKLSEETHRADKAEVELIRLSEKFASVKSENEKLYEMTTQLKQANATSRSEAFSGFQSPSGENVQADMESTPSSHLDLKEKVARLEIEKSILEDKLLAKRDGDNSVAAGLLESANAKCSKLELENLHIRKKLLLMESRLKDLSNSSNSSALNDSSSDNVALMNRLEELQRLVYQKDREFTELNAKYQRNLQKAKELVKSLNNNTALAGGSLHPSFLSSASSFNSGSMDELNMFKIQLKEREDRIIELEQEFHNYKRMKELHERLILSAFYGMTIPMQWKNADKRLERTTITSPPNTASSSMNLTKHSN